MKTLFIFCLKFLKSLYLRFNYLKLQIFKNLCSLYHIQYIIDFKGNFKKIFLMFFRLGNDHAKARRILL